jgi:polyvinyl alcohol dehydrogenase (cytochrome)
MCGLLGCATDAGIEAPSTSQALSSNSSKDWAMSTYDASGSGNNSTEHRIDKHNVDKLTVKWVFDASVAGAPVAPLQAVPAVSHGKTYIGSTAGTFYAIGKHGELLWTFDAGPSKPIIATLLGGDKAPIWSGAVLPPDENSVVFADTAGRVYKLNRDTGAQIWQISVSDHPFGGVWGNALALTDDTLLVGLSSFESAASFAQGYRCCDHRGGVVAIDLASGATRWRYEAIAENAQGPLPAALVTQLGGFEQYGPSGADVWSQPTYDADLKTVFISTGQLFSRAADGGGTNTYDAVIALNAKNGRVRWTRQFSETLDVWRFDLPNPDSTTGKWLDRDMSDSPKIYTLANGRKVVAAGQKSGDFHVIDAATGDSVHSAMLIAQASTEGGFQSGGAYADNTVLQHGLTSSTVSGAPYDGIVMGISRDGDRVKWQLRVPASPLLAGISAANGVAYFQSPFEEPISSAGAPATWALYAVDVQTGDVLKRLPFTNGRALNVPAVSRGHIYAGFGQSFSHGITTVAADGGLICLGLPSDDENDDD